MRVSLSDVSARLQVDVADLQRRMDGRIEWVCEHGVGHTVHATDKASYIHGCDGCCRNVGTYKRLGPGDGSVDVAA